MEGAPSRKDQDQDTWEVDLSRGSSRIYVSGVGSDLRIYSGLRVDGTNPKMSFI